MGLVSGYVKPFGLPSIPGFPLMVTNESVLYEAHLCTSHDW